MNAGNPASSVMDRTYIGYNLREYPTIAAIMSSTQGTPPQIPIEPMLQSAYQALQQGQLAQAEAMFGAVIAFDRNHADAHHVLGMLRYQAGQVREAEALIERAIALRADAAFLTSLANIQLEQKRYEQARENYQRALKINRGFIDAWNNLGLLHMETLQLTEAEDCYRQAIALRGDSVKAWNNLGVIMQDTHRYAEAENAFRAVLQVAPNSPDALLNLGYLWLQQGDFARGWRAYENRWQVRGSDPARGFTQALWLGDADLRGKTILLHAEQGFGDTLQCLRYGPMVAALGARVVLEVPPQLKRLAASVTGAATVLARGETLPPFDTHCPLMSLPLAFKTDLSNIPAHIPYLQVDAEKSAAWRARLGATSALRVGLVWAGNARQHMPRALTLDKQRSMNFAQLSSLLDIDNVAFHSLQIEPAVAAQAAAYPLIDHTASIADFSDTAALIDNLDLVISVDTAVAHLAGALGKSVWMLNRYNGCWRWLTERTDTPWYPTMRIFRQSAPGDWGSVVTDVRRELQQLATNRSSTT
jgi:Tfp pilus assembly protein PilF